MFSSNLLSLKFMKRGEEADRRRELEDVRVVVVVDYGRLAGSALRALRGVELGARGARVGVILSYSKQASCSAGLCQLGGEVWALLSLTRGLIAVSRLD